MTLDDFRKHAQEFRFECRKVKGKVKYNGLIGPEFAGCCGTGMRPLMMRCPHAPDTCFLVGPELVVEEHRLQIARDRLAGKKQFVYGDDTRRQVFVFKTRANAIIKWLELVKAVLDFNESERNEVARLKEQAKRHPIGSNEHTAAILSLGLDH